MKVKISSMYCDHYNSMDIVDRYPVLKEFHVQKDKGGYYTIDIDRIDEHAYLEEKTRCKISVHQSTIYKEPFWLVIEDYI